MMMTMTDVAGWPGYNEIIDISPQKVTGRPDWIGRGGRYVQILFGYS